jgi:hypothetical protein
LKVRQFVAAVRGGTWFMRISVPSRRSYLYRCKLGVRAGWGRLRGGVGERTERLRSVASELDQGPATGHRVEIGGLCPTISVAGGFGNPLRVPIRPVA